MANKENLNKSIAEVFKAEYIIPLYQRNFAWREEQISRLLCDIYESFKNNPKGNYFIGSLVVRKRRDDTYEVIDGQQRLTTLSLIVKILGICNEPHLSYESRPQVEEFFRNFYDGKVNEGPEHPSTIYLREAVNIIKTTNIQEESEGEKEVTIYKEDGSIKADFAHYFASHVILVRVEIPEDTDVESYFEIMNNRGEQLQEHEILKSLLLSEIKTPDGYDLDKQKEFSIIWDACAQMDQPIQKSFNTRYRKRYLGDQYNDFIFTNLASGNDKVKDAGGFTIDDIIAGEHTVRGESNDDISDDEVKFIDEMSYSSIIDFPNFLMHIFKAFYENLYKAADEGNEVPLDAKYLLRVFYKIKERLNPEDFIYNLFRTRVFFDRYIIKTTSDVKDVSWSLKKSQLYSKKMDFVSTFDDNALQERILQVQTMLQVTFRSRKYKRWLQEAIKWFAKQNSLDIDGIEYLSFLDNFILDRYAESSILDGYLHVDSEDNFKKEDTYSLGEGTPHFLLNLIDYLYWVESRNEVKHGIKHSDKVSDFEFKYWNSVEHHLAQHTASFKDDGSGYVDNLGNLFLVYRSTNSRLSDRPVIQKVTEYADKNMGANRQIIYKLTMANNFEWNKKNIIEHYNDLLELVAKRKEILEG